MFKKKAKADAAPTEMGLARMDVRLDRIANLYESLAMRVANLESTTGTGPAVREPSQKAETDKAAAAHARLWSHEPVASGWWRVLRHMLPHKVRALLVDHDAFERVERDNRDLRHRLAAQRRARSRGRVRAHGDEIAPVATLPFPTAIYRAVPGHEIVIVDVGAQDLVSEDHIYAPLQAAGATTIIGFEGLPDTEATPRRADRSVTLLDRFVGSGEVGTFHVTRFDPASSLFQPNRRFLAQFVGLPEMCETVSSFEVQTKRLDDVPEITTCDYLKIDVQGGELDVLKGAQRLLEQTVTVHCEVEFGPVYESQPLFADIDSFLRGQGFELIDLVNAGYNRYRAFPAAADTGSRLLWAEAVYFKSPDGLARGGATNLLKAAYIAHVNYGMFDLAAHFLARYDEAKGSAFLRDYLATAGGFAEASA
jgi:FkbM family methyltransferase